MSTPANTGSEGKSGMSKLLSRAKTILRKKDGSKRFSISGKSPATASTTSSAAAAAAGPSTSKPSEPAPAATPAPEPVKETPAPVTAKDGPQPTKIMRSKIDAERYNRLGQRFKLPKIEASDLTAKPDKEALRVEKEIRVRIHRTCHKCKTPFGGNKICATCKTPRSSKSIRYPPKKTKKSKDKENVPPKVRAADWIEPDTWYGMQEKYVLTMPSKRTGGQDLVRKKPTQRVRRNCHECSVLFQPGIKICTKCEHVRCIQCPRDPPSKKKYPHGYPGDVYPAGGPAPYKVELVAHDPEVLKSVLAKLAKMNAVTAVDSTEKVEVKLASLTVEPPAAEAAA